MSKSLRAMGLLNDRLLTAESIGAALNLAGGEQSPAWVDVYIQQIEAIREAADALETVLRGAEHV